MVAKNLKYIAGKTYIYHWVEKKEVLYIAFKVLGEGYDSYSSHCYVQMEVVKKNIAPTVYDMEPVDTFMVGSEMYNKSVEVTDIARTVKTLDVLYGTTKI